MGVLLTVRETAEFVGCMLLVSPRQKEALRVLIRDAARVLDAARERWASDHHALAPLESSQARATALDYAAWEYEAALTRSRALRRQALSGWRGRLMFGSARESGHSRRTPLPAVEREGVFC